MLSRTSSSASELPNRGPQHSGIRVSHGLLNPHEHGVYNIPSSINNRTFCLNTELTKCDRQSMPLGVIACQPPYRLGDRVGTQLIGLVHHFDREVKDVWMSWLKRGGRIPE